MLWRRSFKDKKSLHRYVAIVHGNLPNDRGVIGLIGPGQGPQKQAVTAKGKTCSNTIYRS